MTTFFLIDELTDGEGVPIHYHIDHPLNPEATLIHLNGRADAPLDWKKARLEAIKAVGKGIKILWEIDLGLFARLYAPLTDKTQYLTLGLSLDHFRDSLWAEFRDHTLGICLYNGSLDFCNQLSWDEEREKAFQEWLQDHSLQITMHNRERLHALYCRDVALEYITLLANQLPDGLLPFLILNTEKVREELLLAQLLSKDRYPSMVRMINTALLNSTHFSSSQVTTILHGNKEIGLLQMATSGICLPEAGILNDAEYTKLQSLLLEFKQKKVPFRFVHEATLTSEWDGLNELITFSRAISPEGKRKLQGFSAAGGVVNLLEV